MKTTGYALLSKQLVSGFIVISLISVLFPKRVWADQAFTKEYSESCQQNLPKASAYMKSICQQLVESEQFRTICAAIPKEDRIRCDNEEAVRAEGLSASDFKGCAKNAAIGAKDAAVLSISVAIESVEALGIYSWSAVKNYFGSSSVSPSLFFSVAYAQSEESQVVTSDSAAYAANTAANENEVIEFVESTKELAVLVKQALDEDMFSSPIFREELRSFFANAASDWGKSFDCMSFRAQADLLCYYMGGGLLGIAGATQREIFRKKFDKGAINAMKGVLRKAITDFRKKRSAR